MKQEIISYLSSLSEDIQNLSQYLYANPETSYKEYKCYSYIVNMLKSHEFQVQENYCNIPTSFYAQYGNGHPKICYICKYTASENLVHSFANNVNASISIAAALGLAKVIPKSGGSVVVLGCPGEYVNGSELTLTKEKCFDDIDIIIALHCDIHNSESGTSMATIPIKIKYSKSTNNISKETAGSSSLDAYLFILNALNQFIKGLNTVCAIETLSMKDVCSNLNASPDTEIKLYLSTPNIIDTRLLEKTTEDIVNLTCKIMNISCEMSLFQLPTQELLSNKSLSRLFSHNLKECGIINIDCCKNASYGLGIGTISNITPCIYPSISITEKPLVSCPSSLFALETQTKFCKNNMLKAAQALAITGLDIIENQDLLKEIIQELQFP